MSTYEKRWIREFSNILIGKQDTIEIFKKKIKIHFRTEEETEMSEYLGCMVQKGNETLYMYQVNLIMTLKTQFER